MAASHWLYMRQAIRSIRCIIRRTHDKALVWNKATGAGQKCALPPRHPKGSRWEQNHLAAACNLLTQVGIEQTKSRPNRTSQPCRKANTTTLPAERRTKRRRRLVRLRILDVLYSCGS